MLIGKNSIGYHIVLVEFEDVNVDFRMKTSNSETEAVRKGMTQIYDWKRWMDNNREYFLKSIGLPNIANKVPSWGIRYCLVVGRRSRMDDVANQIRWQKDSEMKIISYDRLVDNIEHLSNGF